MTATLATGAVLEATLPLPLPPASWHRAAVSAHEALLALHKVEAREPVDEEGNRAQWLDHALLKGEAILRLRELGAALDDHGHDARADVWRMAAAIRLGLHDVDVPGYVARVGELVEEAGSTVPCPNDSRPGEPA